MKNKNKLWIIGVLCVLFFASCSTTVPEFDSTQQINLTIIH